MLTETIKNDPLYEKKDAVNKLIRQYKDVGQTYQAFADWLSEPMKIDDDAYKFMWPISKQNVNEWFSYKRVPYPDKFIVIKLVAAGNPSYTAQVNFCEKMLEILKNNGEDS